MLKWWLRVIIVCVISTSLFCEAKIKCQGRYFHAPDTQDSSLSITNSAASSNSARHFEKRLVNQFNNNMWWYSLWSSPCGSNLFWTFAAQICKYSVLCVFTHTIRPKITLMPPAGCNFLSQLCLSVLGIPHIEGLTINYWDAQAGKSLGIIIRWLLDLERLF